MAIHLDFSGPLKPATLPDCAVRLHAPRFISPQVLNIGWPREGTVQPDGSTVAIKGLPGQEFSLASPMPSGTRVIAVLDRWFWACEAGAAEAFKAQQKAGYEARLKAEEDARHAREQLLLAEAKAFNASIQIPVRWTSGYESVLSGLSEKSWGDGSFKKTVQHILLLEDLSDGRLKRSANDFLCGFSGKHYTERQSWLKEEGTGERIPAKITCRACLKVAERLAKRSRKAK